MRNKNLDAFEARMKKIAKQEGAPQQYIAGEGNLADTTFSAAAMKRAQKPRKQGSKNLFKQLPKIGLSFVLGGVTMLAARLISFHFVPANSFGNEMKAFLMLQGAEIAAAFGLLVTLAVFLKLNTGAMKTAAMAGLAFMLVGEPDVAKHAPNVWQEMFSPDYAAGVLAPQASLENNLRTIRDVVMTSL